MPLLITPFAERDLIRQPEQSDPSLQAFDAADEYLLNRLHELGVDASDRVLLLNDAFGALATSLAGRCEVVSSGDSFLAALALEKNLARHNLAPASVTFTAASEELAGAFTKVLIRVPKTLALLEEQLIRLQGRLAPATPVIAAAMIKHLPRAAGDLLEKYVGPVQASLAVKKARLLTALAQPRTAPVASPYPTSYRLEQPPLTLVNHANLFCREGLDIGTRAFLPHLPQGAGRVADLGCGNGVIGICYALANPQAELTLVDESFMAVQSAAHNWRAALGQRPVTIRAADGLADVPAASLDRVLCNPPFHQQQVVGDYLAWRMFRQAQRALAKGGDLWLVGNRHLGYHVKLRQLFGRVETVASTSKFVVLRAINI